MGRSRLVAVVSWGLAGLLLVSTLAGMASAEDSDRPIRALPTLAAEETGYPKVDDLRQQLAQTDDLRKWSILVHLLYVEDPSRRLDYLDLLHESVRSILEEGRPFPYLLTEEGQLVPSASGEGHHVSELFLEWVEARDLELQEELDRVVVEATPLVLLSKIADSYSSDVLLAALESPNFLVVIPAIGGVARLRDESSLEAVIKALKRFPLLQQQALATSLLPFENEEADRLALSLVEGTELSETIQQLIDQR